MSELLLIGAVRGRPSRPTGAAPHHQIAVGGWTGLALACDAVADLSVEDDAAHLAKLQHDILCHYIIAGEVLPIALGAAFSAEAALTDHLARQLDTLERRHQPLTGKVEFTLSVHRADQTGTPVSHGGDGAQHLRRRRLSRDRMRANRAARVAFLAALSNQLSAHSCAYHERGQSKTGRLARYDVLLSRDKVDDWLTSLSKLASSAERHGLALSVTGPCPAFSFVDAAADV
ncbi:MAG: GvpL/GvpF family gas vesicle protein [Pseudomonadota bacterium]